MKPKDDKWWLATDKQGRVAVVCSHAWYGAREKACCALDCGQDELGEVLRISEQQAAKLRQEKPRETTDAQDVDCGDPHTVPSGSPEPTS